MARRRVTYSQLGSLWEFLNEHRNIATGHNKTSQAREYMKRMWQAVADILNSQGEGAEKDWKSWSKYWNDYKSKLKAKAAAVRASQQRTGGGLSSEAQLSELELQFLTILGEDFGAGLPGARVEPFDEPIDAASIDVLTSGGGSENSIFASIPASQPPRPRAPVPSSPPPPATPPAPGSSAAATSSPRRRGRARGPRSSRRRIRRRELPMTMDTARRSLIAISEQGVAEDRRRNDLLETLVQEIIKIKDILNSRLPGLPPTDE